MQKTPKLRRAVVLLHVVDRDDLVWIPPLVQRTKVEAYVRAEGFELGAVPDLPASQPGLLQQNRSLECVAHALLVRKLPGSHECDQRWQCADMN